MLSINWIKLIFSQYEQTINKKAELLELLYQHKLHVCLCWCWCTVSVCVCVSGERLLSLCASARLWSICAHDTQ